MMPLLITEVTKKPKDQKGPKKINKRLKDPSGKWGDMLAMLPTRAPKAMWQYLTWLSKHPSLGTSTMQEFITLSAVDFLTSKPFLHGLKIRQARAVGTAPNMAANKASNGIVQVNVSLCPVILPDGRKATGKDISQWFKDTADEIQEAGILAVREDGTSANASTASLVYSFLYWLSIHKYPPGSPLTYVKRYEPREKE